MTWATDRVLVLGAAAFMWNLATKAEAIQWQAYADQRIERTGLRLGSILGTADFPQSTATTELNLKLKFKDIERWVIASDVSAIGRAAEGFRVRNQAGRETDPHPSGNDRRRLWASISELYTSFDVEDAFTITAGKKRVLWGPGFSANPSDLLNPPKDPVDPSAERAGGWLLMGEKIMPAFTVTAVFSPWVKEDKNGFWQRGLDFPRANAEGREQRYLGALRLYTLLAETDLNLMLFRPNNYKDTRKGSTDVAASAAKFVTNAWELHGEAIASRGTARDPESTRLSPEALLGSRYAFANESEFLFEYLYRDAGLSAEDFSHLVWAFSRSNAAGPSALKTFGSVSSRGTVIAQRLRRNYITLSHQRLELSQDLFFSANTTVNCDDGSGLAFVSLQWQWQDNIHFNVGLFRPYEWDSSRGAQDLGSSSKTSEMDLNPQTYRAHVAARAYF